MMTRTVLIIDDSADGDPSRGADLQSLLAGWGYQSQLEAPATENAAPATEGGSGDSPAVIIHRSTGADREALQSLQSQYPLLPIIVIDDREVGADVLDSLRAAGAFDCLAGGIAPTQLRPVIERALELAAARRENEVLRRQLQDRGSFGDMVGNSESMRQVYALIEQVASSSASVLITGESGTGKEMVARTIHRLSPRCDAPFIAINCSAIPETLMESELFGHEKGAFTGAASRRAGCFELAHTGTLLLDEISEMPAVLQAKLLRVIEERQVRRLGSRREIPIDVRLLAATNRDPHLAVEEGALRSDLLYRLNVIRIDLPSLKDRREDLPLLAQHLIAQLAEKHNRPARFMSPAALAVLQYHAWPGNVRELRNVIERAVIICSGEQIERHHFAPYPIDQRERASKEDTISFPVGTPLEEVERQMILRTLQKTGNNKTRAAELLGVSLKTMHNKLNLYRERGQLDDE
jgi:DNA-binding NtrC family response regulator